jgi:hypothetical protein
LASEAGTFRSGNYAVYHGHAYRAYGDSFSSEIALAVEAGDPIPAGLPADPRDPDRIYLAQPSDVSEWYASSWTFRWRGELFSFYSLRDGVVTGLYIGGDGSFADEHLKRVGSIDYEGSFPLEEVSDPIEHRTDLLAKWKERHQR